VWAYPPVLQKEKNIIRLVLPLICIKKIDCKIIFKCFLEENIHL